MRFTLWPSIYDKDAHQSVDESWSQIVERFSAHQRLTNKDKAWGFGPYALAPPPKPCNRHQDGRERSSPHRCDSCVERLTLAVFDVDTGTPEDVSRTEDALAQEDCMRLWYSTHSHRQDKPSYRLILPVSQEIAPETWANFRHGVIRRFNIPCDPGKCGGKSHFYFGPSCKPGADPKVWSAGGKFLDVGSIALVEAKPKVTFANLDGFTWEPPAEPSGPIDVMTLRAKVMLRVQSLTRKGETKKASALVQMLQGRPLALKGSRNETTFKLAGTLAWALPGESLGTLVFLLRPSVEAMISQGSSLSLEAVERMLLTAMRSRAEAAYLEKTTQQNMSRELEDFRAALFKSAGLVGVEHG